MRLKFLQENLIDEKSIIKILKDYIDISRKPKLGSVFLTKDGTFINLGENEDDSHGDIISYLENEDIFLFDDHWQFSENFGYIRMNSGTTTDFNAYIEFLEDKPTAEQYDGIENWLYYILNSGVKEVEINVPNSKSIRYSLVDYLPEDIIKKVKRYYGSGTLYESDSSVVYKDISEQITNEFLDVWDDFYHCSTEDVLDLLEYIPSDKIDASSPMFILPNGKIVNVADVVEQWDYEYPLVHHALPQVMAYVILKDICSRYGVEAEQFMYEEDGLLDNVTDEMIHNLTYAKDWARINCGTLAVESRFYCVLPNHMKSAQYYTLEEWLLWGEQHNKKEVLVFCGNEQQSQKYKFDELFVEGIMKKIKRFYSSGVLHEGKDNSKILYRGEGDSNYSVGRTPMAGLFYAIDYDDASNFSDNVVKYKLNSNSKIYKGQSSLNYCIENDLMNIQDKDLKNMLGVSTLIDMYEESSVPDGYFPKDEYLDDRPFFGTQLIAKKDLQKKGYDGAYWKWEDDLTPQQYQIWNMSVVEKADQIKEDFSNIDKSEYLKFQSYVESIIDRKMKIVNRELDRFGFEVEYIDDYDFTDNDQWIGVFYNEIQDAADVFPIAINIPFLYKECKKDKYLKDDLPYHIEKTIWHEAGHGIFEYLYDVFDLEDLDEEKVVEEYASYQVGDMNSPGDLLDYLYQYLEDN